MTENKTLKRRVRERMSKTGERYTAARRQVVAKSAEAAPAADVEAPPAADTALSGAEFRGERRNTDATLVARTGYPWAHWFDVLDAWGARERAHTDIARHIANDLGVDGWWAQEITVGYEYRIGRRDLGMRTDGRYVTATKTVNVPVERLYTAWLNADQRQAWLPDVTLTHRSGTPPRTANFDVKGGDGRLVAGFTAKGDKSMVAVEHSRIPDADTADRYRQLWRERLSDLKRSVEAREATTSDPSRRSTRTRR